MGVKPLPSVSHAFARIAWRTVVTLFVLALGLFGVASYRLVHANQQQHLEQQAQLCSHLVRSGDPEQFRTAAAGLQVYSRGFVAIGVFAADGTLQSVYPDTARHRQAVAAAVPAGEPGTFQGPSPNRDGNVQLVSVAMPMQQDCLGRFKVFAVFETPSQASTLAALLLFFGLLIGVTALAAFTTLRRWFEHHVVQPLQTFNDIALDRQGATRSSGNGMCKGTSLETARLSEILHEFIDTLAETDERARRVEEESLKRIRDREAGFDQQLRRFRDQATTDPLTKLRNRAYLDEILAELFAAHANRNEALAAIMLDLDNFKNYNDSHGHQAGDALLRFVGALLRGSIRPQDHAVRYGGDEFLLLLPAAGAQQAAGIADRIIKLFRQYSSCLKQDLRLSMSAGVASLPDPSCPDGLELIARADRALYGAKASGKDGVFAALPGGTQAVAISGNNSPELAATP